MAHEPPVEHVVVLMLENCSFDHMLGRMRHSKVNGIVDAHGKKVRIRDKAGSDASFALTLRHKKGFEGPSYSFTSVTTQLYGTKKPSPQALAAPPLLSGFVLNYLNQLKGRRWASTTRQTRRRASPSPHSRRATSPCCGSSPRVLHLQ